MAITLPGYRITGRLGKGGMSHVFLATQHSFERQVAIKVLTPSLALEPSFAERFMHEARTIARLNHPHIVPVYDVGEHQGYYYLSMEYVTGGSLKQRIREGMEPAQVEQVLRQMAMALHYAGEHGFIHRDVKPDNIMFRADGSALLMDFGIAASTVNHRNVLDSHARLGTPKYMSPEQHRADELDPRADLYALGCVLHEMLTGEPPFQADSPARMAERHLQDPVPLLPRAVRRYQPLLRRLMAKDREQRPADGTAVIELLDSLPQASTPAAFKPVHEPPAVALAPRLRLREEKTGRSWRGSLYRYDIYLVADDFEQFQSHYAVMRSGLQEWQAQRGRRCQEVAIKATLHPWISGRVKDYLRKMRHSDGLEWLAGLPMRINLVAADGQPIERLEWPAETDNNEQPG
ncbi:serine/threonine protein kinase PpkA [Alcanivorax hongdengensis A-11-3]|uniref:Serine/threonine protein kinase PpkA n=1 Tax=Alcanivorax hongdengensis A-11-3 TaxID=1177179 RepID=L0WD02_9GAMM|nr:serine/threonine-protein kinase [Alcanivorax hongdengensis]EKF74831.1 serine/threonine protein kinase PpkA [Alcanivorax hongdengensis A-11-3]